MRRYHVAEAAMRLALLLAGVVLLAGCDGDAGANTSLTPNPGDGQNSAVATREQQQREMMREFLEGAPAKDYTSFEEAEQAAGYHIPRPSPDYPVAYGITTLQWFQGLERPQSRTIYWLPSLADVGIGVDVAPNYYYRDSDPTAGGTAAMVGGKAGWMLEEDDIGWVFAFECGSVDQVKVWCQVTGARENGWDAFDHFVSTLQ